MAGSFFFGLAKTASYRSVPFERVADGNPQTSFFFGEIIIFFKSILIQNFMIFSYNLCSSTQFFFSI